MAWKFDQHIVDIIWTHPIGEIEDSASIVMGDSTSDLTVDTGDRTNDTSTLDQGQRIIDGDI